MRNGVKISFLWTALLLLLLYTVAGFWIIPSVASKKVPPMLSELLGTEVSFDKISLNPFTMELRVPQVSIKDSKKNELLHLDEIYLDLSPIDSLATLSLYIEAFRLKRMSADIELYKDGSFNFSHIIEHLGKNSSETKKSSEAEGSLPPLTIKQFAIESSKLGFKDNTTPEPVRVDVTNLNFGVADISTVAERSGTAVFEIETENSAFIHSYSNVLLSPLKMDGEIFLQKGNLNKIDGYLKKYTNLSLPKGRLEIYTGYYLSKRADRLEAGLKEGRVLVEDFTLASSCCEPVKVGRFGVDGIFLKWPERGIKIADISLKDTDLYAYMDSDKKLSFEKWLKPSEEKKSPEIEKEPASNNNWQMEIDRVSLLAKTRFDAPKFRVSAAHVYLFENMTFDTNGSLNLPLKRIEVKNLLLHDIQAGNDPVKIESLTVENGTLKLPQNRLDIERAALGAPSAKITLLKSKKINLSQLFAFKDKKEAKKEKRSVEKRKPFIVALKKFDLRDGSVRFEDRTLKAPSTLKIDELQAQLKEFSYPQKEAAPFSLSLKTPSKGRITAEGDFLLNPLESNLKLKADRVALSPYLPYIKEFVNIDIPRGYAAAEASVKYSRKSRPEAKIDFGFSLNDLQIDHSIKRRKIASLKKLIVSGAHLKLFPESMKIDTVEIAEPYVRVDIDTDRSTNLDGLLVKKGAEPKSKKAKKREKKEPFGFSVTNLKIVNGSSDFSDLSLPLPFKTHIHDLNGGAIGISNIADDVAKVALKGVVQKYGMAKIDALVDSKDPLKKSSVDVDFRNLDVTDLSPYTGKYIGYAIKDGRMWLKLKYEIDRGRLKSDNKIVLKKLELGEKIESNESINAPIHLALALLKDANGVIDLDIPIEGNVTDPKFKIGKVVWQAIGNMITGIVTAPFRFLGSILGIKGEELQYVDFEPGSYTIDPTEKEKLDKLLSALSKRPLLTLELKGVYHPKADSKAIAEKRVRELIVEKLGKKRVEDIKTEVTSRVLESLLLDRAGEKSVAKIKKEFEKIADTDAKRADETLYRKMLYEALEKGITVTEAELKNLAASRSKQIEAYLSVKGLDPKRVRIEEPVKTDRLGETGLIELKLKLGAGG